MRLFVAAVLGWILGNHPAREAEPSGALRLPDLVLFHRDEAKAAEPGWF
jgi:hypothetical protein